jgi:hypothetical protein
MSPVRVSTTLTGSVSRTAARSPRRTATRKGGAGVSRVPRPEPGSVTLMIRDVRREFAPADPDTSLPKRVSARCFGIGNRS